MEKMGRKMNRIFFLRSFFFSSNWIMKEFLQSKRDYLWGRFSVGEYCCSEYVFRAISI